MFKPIINCGLKAGDTPICWEGNGFNTEEECESWIKDNHDNFTLNELAGGVYPMEVFN